MYIHQFINNKTNNTMHFISASLIKPFTKPLIKAGAKLICISLLFITQTAHADFRKALDAYMARDGATMLKEVKDAVDKKNDDGLMLFLSALQIDEQTSRKISLKEVFPAATNRMQTTLESIFNPSQQTQIIKLLEAALSSSTTDARYAYYFKRLSKFTSQDRNQKEVIKELRNLANCGSSNAAVDLAQWYGSSSIAQPEAARRWFIKSAELGDAYSSASLAFSYLGYSSKYFLSSTNCENLKINGSCIEKDLKKGAFWIKEAVKNVDKNQLHMRRFAFEMGNMLSGNKGDHKKANYSQAYLWYLVALNSPDISGLGVSEKRILSAIRFMHENHQLSAGAQELDSFWGDENKRNQILFPRKLTQLPNLLLEARQKIKLNSEPVFSYLRITDELPYQLEVFANGDVKLGFYMQNTSNYMQISPLSVQEFLVELNKLTFKNRHLFTSARDESSYSCNVCKGNDNMFTMHTSKGKDTYYIGYDRNDKIDSKIDIQIAEIFALVEKYFPTVKLRCNIGNSKTYNNECHVQDENLITLTSKGK